MTLAKTRTAENKFADVQTLSDIEWQRLISLLEEHARRIPGNRDRA